MTPRQADVAFVLESVGGVRALYATISGRVAAHFDFAIEVEYGGRVLAEVQYALLRVMNHEDCARVFLFHVSAPPVVSREATPLFLTPSERETARARVPPPPTRRDEKLEMHDARDITDPTVLIVDDDHAVEDVVREALVDPSRWVVAFEISVAVKVAGERTFDLILCDAQRAFGLNGLLAKLPLDMASRVFVLTTRSQLVDARWRLQGSERILAKPLESYLLRERLTRLAAINPLWAPDLKRVTVEETTTQPRRRLVAPPATEPFRVLLVDVEDDVHEALRRVFRGEARHAMRPDPEEATELALSTPFHLRVCSAKAALSGRSFLDGIAREDPLGADTVIVVAPTRDVPYVKHKLDQVGRKNRVLALPIDDTSLRHEVFRDHPMLAARVAVADVADAGSPHFPRVRYRRVAALIVDEDPTTQILFAAAAGADDQADVALASTSMEAFEHVMSRPVDVLIVSATMRGEGGEPFYRVLWRLNPELKSRSVLVMASDAVPPSTGPRSHPPRVLERPVTRAAIARIVDAFRGR